MSDEIRRENTYCMGRSLQTIHRRPWVENLPLWEHITFALCGASVCARSSPPFMEIAAVFTAAIFCLATYPNLTGTFYGRNERAPLFTKERPFRSVAHRLPPSARAAPINQRQHTGAGMGSNDGTNIRRENLRLRKPFPDGLPQGLCSIWTSAMAHHNGLSHFRCPALFHFGELDIDGLSSGRFTNQIPPLPRAHSISKQTIFRSGYFSPCSSAQTRAD